MILISLIGINAYLFFAINKYSDNRYINRIKAPLTLWNKLCKPCTMFWLCGFEMTIITIVTVNPFVVMLSFPLAVLSIIGTKYLSV